MSNELEEAGLKYLEKEFGSLTRREKAVIRSILEGKNISRNVNSILEEKWTYGERVADAVARFGGSWAFLLLFAAALTSWVIVNSYLLIGEAFDPYPYILLNLFLSMLAAIQAPIIMMSQNRQAARDRLDAAHDYEVNLKAELEIRQMQEKLDELREQKWQELLDLQNRQILFLEQMLSRLGD
ncbi:MAG: DUF1003 domain-containing protein [Acidobacteriota bacterium]|nr:MAG: DUF1003 domain-containing protein [Acidobacteriota bacterium]